MNDIAETDAGTLLDQQLLELALEIVNDDQSLSPKAHKEANKFISNAKMSTKKSWGRTK
ncbi:hypothetical protein [Rhodococcus qingshengii]|uniref:hypothetical protein n=1 Tax=Rhodococcus qingshengii TaxID=334542 RepID=UPI00237D2EC6|nr:hypothetical protein [Rhodococcus qingshengii]WCT06016.1 hypothetical protein PI247_29810 [Rhodococcus qingshengii]